MNSTKMYPGMLDESIELFFHEETKTLMAIYDGKIQKYIDLPQEATLFLDVIIESDEKLKEILEEWHPNDYHSQKMQLAICRFGSLNFLPDNCGNQTLNDMLDCPFVNSCKGCGVICKGVSYQEENLKPKEINAIKQMISDKKNLAIADCLNMAEGTYNVFRTNLYEKLNIHSKPELARVGAKLGLI